MKIDIYKHVKKGYIAVRAGHPIPQSWAGAKYFKTIELNRGDVRIGMGDADQVLTAIEKDGYAVLGEFGGA
ncbi:hypothetical protein [Stenotrophomonas maltophilia]|uniref:Uncharacterized protein n=1 Tax=Stenotrophomonas maltophilia TaxID=40324 RepID=A0A2W6I4R7_STEMA|nr:hypothetical protein [Stenotrophomonas maltophilia]PZS90084.1 hypothetical protein A7X83_11350 [Stenotrophomonas maltophilia]